MTSTTPAAATNPALLRSEVAELPQGLSTELQNWISTFSIDTMYPAWNHVDGKTAALASLTVRHHLAVLFATVPPPQESAPESVARFTPGPTDRREFRMPGDLPRCLENWISHFAVGMMLNAWQGMTDAEGAHASLTVMGHLAQAFATTPPPGYTVPVDGS